MAQAAFKTLDMCIYHNEYVTYYCKKCDMSTCKICRIQNHRSHKFAEIEESSEGIKAAIEKDITTQIKNLESNIADIDQCSVQYRAGIYEVILDIREEGIQIKQLIDKKIEGLIKSVKEKETKNLQSLQAICNELKHDLDKALEQQKFFQDTQVIKDTDELLQKVKQIRSQINALEERQIPVMPSVKYAKKTVSYSKIEKLFGRIE